MFQRVITFEQCTNFRDIGGYPTRDGGQTQTGLIYRSSALNRLTPADQALLETLDIRTAFDLRLDDDLRQDGPDQPGPGVKVIRAPTTLIEESLWQSLLGNGKNFRFVDCYISSLAPRAAYHADLLRQIIAHLDHAVVIHCSAGKDRTGVAIALLLRLAGVVDSAIIDDYALTEKLLADLYTYFHTAFLRQGMPAPIAEEILASHPDTIRGTLAYLDQTFGSVENYFIQGGSTPAEIDEFRARFVTR